MKVDDDELAEAALLLAHTEPQRSMPKALELAILRQAEGAPEARLSTTKVGAVAVDEAPPAVVRQVSFARRWGGWLAAAACFSIAVYQWRLHTLTPPRTAAYAPVSTPSITLRDRASAIVAEVRPDDASVTVTSLPESSAGEHYELWLSPAGPEQAVAVGAFVCKEACVGRPFSLRDLAPDMTAHRAFITKSPVARPAFASRGLHPGAVIVGEGSDGR